MLRQFRLFICILGVVWMYQINQGVLFYVAGMVAFANLFSGQFLCGQNACQTDNKWFNRDPISLFHYATTLMGGLFLILAIHKMYS